MVETMISSCLSSPDLLKRRVEKSEKWNYQSVYFVRRPNYDIEIATNTSVVNLRPQIHARLHGARPYVAWRHKQSMDKVKFRDNICVDQSIPITMTC